jgi:hypothetical protein
LRGTRSANAPAIGPSADIGDHLDRQRRAKHRARITTGDVISEQAEGDRRRAVPTSAMSWARKR